MNLKRILMALMALKSLADDIDNVCRVVGQVRRELEQAWGAGLIDIANRVDAENNDTTNPELPPWDTGAIFEIELEPELLRDLAAADDWLDDIAWLVRTGGCDG